MLSLSYALTKGQMNCTMCNMMVPLTATQLPLTCCSTAHLHLTGISKVGLKTAQIKGNKGRNALLWVHLLISRSRPLIWKSEITFLRCLNYVFFFFLLEIQFEFCFLLASLKICRLLLFHYCNFSKE